MLLELKSKCSVAGRRSRRGDLESRWWLAKDRPEIIVYEDTTARSDAQLSKIILGP